MEAVRPTPAWRDVPVPASPPAVEGPDALRGRQPDVVVVGLGASGLEAVVALAAAGADVLGIDAHGIAAGAAGANGGFLLAGLAMFHHEAVAALGREAAVAWHRRTQEELDRLAAEEPTFRRVGSLRTAADAAELEDVRAQQRAMRADGIAVEDHDGPQGHGILVPGDGVFHPVARCNRLATQAIGAGATLVTGVRVTAVAPGRVALEGGIDPVTTPRVLVAVDGGLELLVPRLAGRVRTARLQMLATAPDDGVSMPRPRYHRRGLDYVQQLPSGEVLLGGGRDVGGVGEWGAPAVPTATVQDHLDRVAAAFGVTAQVTHRWAARAAWSDDRLPVDERIDDGVHVVGAYSGHGNVLGGLLAREAAMALLG